MAPTGQPRYIWPCRGLHHSDIFVLATECCGALRITASSSRIPSIAKYTNTQDQGSVVVANRIEPSTANTLLPSRQGQVFRCPMACCWPRHTSLALAPRRPGVPVKHQVSVSGILLGGLTVETKSLQTCAVVSDMARQHVLRPAVGVMMAHFPAGPGRERTADNCATCRRSSCSGAVPRHRQ